MSLPDRTSSLVERILASRTARGERDRAMRERAQAGHARASEMMLATAARWQQRRKEVYERLQEIKESHEAQRRRLAPLRTPQQLHEAVASSPAMERKLPATHPVTTHQAPPVHETHGHETHGHETHGHETHGHETHGHETHRGKGGARR